MSKATVTRLFIGGMLAVLAGAILAVASVWVAIANDVFIMDGPDIVGLGGGSLGVALVAVALVGSETLNTARIANKAWFIALLLTGIFSLGFLAMIAYVVAGPDGTIDSGRRNAQVPGSVVNA